MYPWWHISATTSSVDFYEALTSAPDELTRARVIAEAFERLEERYPHLRNLATQGHVRESELRLQKEIEQIRADLKLDIEQLRGEVARTMVDLLKWIVPLMLAQVAAIAALVKLIGGEILRSPMGRIQHAQA